VSLLIPCGTGVYGLNGLIGTTGFVVGVVVFEGTTGTGVGVGGLTGVGVGSDCCCKTKGV
jgi:hypothetical protein